MVRSSISRRLILALSGGTVVMWLSATVIASLIMYQGLNEAFDSAQQEAAQRLLRLAVHDVHEREEEHDEPYEVSGAGVAEHDEYLTYQLRDMQGRILLRSHDAPTKPYPAALRTGFVQTETLRIYTEGTINDTMFIQVAEPLAHRHRAINRSALALLAPLALLLPLSAFGVSWIVRRGMRPVVELQQAISRRGGGNLSPIENEGLPEEIAPIADAVDRLLERIRTALDAERAFAVNSAHELRTPLASLLAQVQRLAASLVDKAAKKRVILIEADVKRLHRLTEKLLQLSRADAGVALVSETIDLLPALRLIVDELSRDGTSGNQILFNEGGQHKLHARIDVDAFAIVMRNLIENALIHGNKNDPVRVYLEDHKTVHVVNAGPVVPKEKLGELMRRFTRGSSRSEGSGLGLAIADTIMRQAGGYIELQSPAANSEDGFEVIVHLC